MKTVEKHYVSFLSPGSFVDEDTRKSIAGWDTAKAVKMAKTITERYNATPYAFFFTTVLTAEAIDDGMGGKLKVEERETARSGKHFLGGEIKSFDDVVKEGNPKDNILLSNMKCNDYPFVVENRNSWKAVQPFEKEDCVVDRETGIIRSNGDEKQFMEYRRKFTKAKNRYYAEGNWEVPFVVA